jgi:hypothetical protein
MRKLIKAAGVLAAAGILLTTVLPAATADTVDSTISGGSLTSTTSGANLSGVTLDGTDKAATGTSSSPWSISDSRGTGQAWTLSVTATVPTSAAGTVETTARTIPVSNLTITPGTLTAGSGADPVAGISAPALAMSGSAQALVASAGANRGTYALTPTYSLAVPANTYRSNYFGAVGSTALLPYVSTLTYTIS